MGYLNTAIVVSLAILLFTAYEVEAWTRYSRIAITRLQQRLQALTRIKTLAFVFRISCGYIANGLYGLHWRHASTKFGFMKSVEILVMVVLGGMGSMFGSVVSAAVLFGELYVPC